MGNRL
jgi:hypothetical protein